MTTTVSTRPSHSAASTARDLRALMRDQQISPATLAWILRCGMLRAILLRYVASNWYLNEVLDLIQACSPASKTVPLWGLLAGPER